MRAPRGPNRRDDGSDGFVMLPVIWVVFLLGLAAASYNLTVRSGINLTSASMASTEAAALADAGVHLAIHDLVNASAVRAWKRRLGSDGRAFRCTIGAANVTIAIRDEGGKVDLNSAVEPVLVALFAGVGVPREQAIRHAAAILDYRDAYDNRTFEGAEREQYREAGLATGPKNDAFDTPIELAQVLGFDADLVRNVLPYLTVHSGLSGIDPSKASPDLLQILAAGRTATRSAIAGASGLPAEMLATSRQRVFSIVAHAVGERGGSFTREAVVRLAGAGSAPYILLGWQQVSIPVSSDTVELGPC